MWHHVTVIRYFGGCIPLEQTKLVPIIVCSCYGSLNLIVVYRFLWLLQAFTCCYHKKKNLLAKKRKRKKEEERDKERKKLGEHDGYYKKMQQSDSITTMATINPTPITITFKNLKIVCLLHKRVSEFQFVSDFKHVRGKKLGQKMIHH